MGEAQKCVAELDVDEVSGLLVVSCGCWCFGAWWKVLVCWWVSRGHCYNGVLIAGSGWFLRFFFVFAKARSLDKSWFTNKSKCTIFLCTWNFLADEGRAPCMFVKQGQNLLKVVHFYDFFVKDLAQLLFQNSVEAPLSIVIKLVKRAKIVPKQLQDYMFQA